MTAKIVYDGIEYRVYTRNGLFWKLHSRYSRLSAAVETFRYLTIHKTIEEW